MFRESVRGDVSNSNAGRTNRSQCLLQLWHAKQHQLFRFSIVVRMRRIPRNVPLHGIAVIRRFILKPRRQPLFEEVGSPSRPWVQ